MCILQLRDGTSVNIRRLTDEDYDRSLTFFQNLPHEDLLYFRSNMTRPEAVRRRIEDQKSTRVQRLIAVADGHMVAEGALEIGLNGWGRYTGELRLIVAQEHQSKGLGLGLANELYWTALQAGIEDMVVKISRFQTAGLRIFEKLGFSEDLELSKKIHEKGNERESTVVYHCRVDNQWQILEDYFMDTDWERRK